MLRMALGNYEHVATGFKVGRSSYQAKGRVHKKNPEKVWSFAKPGGGGALGG